MSKSWRIFWACTAGAGIGALVALEINSYFWWLGLIVGGVAGYLLYDIKAVVSAIPRAWRAAPGWKPNKEVWKIRGLATLAYFFVVMSSCLVALSALWLGSHLTSMSIMSMGEFYNSSELPFLVSFAVAVSIFVAFLGGVMRTDLIGIFIKFGNPVAVFVYWPVVILRHLPAALWRAAIFIAVFAKALFLTIHSDERLLCGIDAAIGASIGYFVGSAVIGALAGGVFGVINYEIVSKRIIGLDRA